MEAIRLFLDGRWNARDLSYALLEIENYAQYAQDGEFRDAASPSELDVEGGANSITIHGYRYEIGRLEILKISYASPGFCDLAGIGKVVEQLRIFLQFIIEFKSNRHIKELDLEERRIAIRERKLQTIVYAKQNNLLKESVFIENHGADNLLRLVDDGQIVGVKSIPKQE